MKNINIFADTSIINRMCIEEKNDQYEEDRTFLSKILNLSIKNTHIKIFVNPSVKQEIKSTPDQERREKLLNIFNRFHFTEFNKSIFGKTKKGKEKGITFPVNFLTLEEKRFCQELKQEMPSLTDDMKIIADALFNKEIDILLSVEHHIHEDLVKFLLKKGIKAKVFNPKKCFDYLRNL
jgi:predicted DNA-binding protein (UPF0278 family)